MKVITLLTDPDEQGFREFLKPSCDYYNLDLTILQPGINYTSHRLKDLLLLEYLKSVPETEIIFFSDGYDTVFLADETEVLDKFRAFNASLVFSAEVNCWPARELEAEYPPSSHHFKYLNSGAFIGQAGFITALYKKYPLFTTGVNARYNWSNQFFWHHVYLKNQESIRLDTNCEIFYNTATLSEKIRGINVKLNHDKMKALYDTELERLKQEIRFTEKDRITLQLTNTLPCHIHFAGPVGKQLMTDDFFKSIKPWQKE